MAENAVHLSSIEHVKPTIFEVWAEESFMATLQPAFQLLSDFIRSKFPSCETSLFKFVFKWPDETFLVFNFIMQSTYMDWFSASFSESFYGLKRVNVKAPSEPLTRRAKLISLIGLVGAPYVMTKLKTIVDKHVFQNSINNDENVLKTLRTFRTLYSIVRAVKIYHYISYLSGFGMQHSVFHRLAGVQLVHEPQPSASWSDILSLLRHETNKSKLICPLTFKVISQIFELGAFSLQFINWWNNSDTKVLNLNKNPVPEPIDPVDTRQVCPICKGPWKLEVALSTSGLVYCYSCITSALSETGHCPISGLPFTMDDLIRLYPSVS